MAKRARTRAEINLKFNVRLIKDNPRAARVCLREAGISKTRIQKGRVTEKEVDRLMRCMLTKRLFYNQARFHEYVKAMEKVGTRRT